MDKVVRLHGKGGRSTCKKRLRYLLKGREHVDKEIGVH